MAAIALDGLADVLHPFLVYEQIELGLFLNRHPIHRDVVDAEIMKRAQHVLFHRSVQPNFVPDVVVEVLVDVVAVRALRRGRHPQQEARGEVVQNPPVRGAASAVGLIDDDVVEMVGAEGLELLALRNGLNGRKDKRCVDRSCVARKHPHLDVVAEYPLKAGHRLARDVFPVHHEQKALRIDRQRIEGREEGLSSSCCRDHQGFGLASIPERLQLVQRFPLHGVGGELRCVWRCYVGGNVGHFRLWLARRLQFVLGPVNLQPSLGDPGRSAEKIIELFFQFRAVHTVFSIRDADVQFRGAACDGIGRPIAASHQTCYLLRTKEGIGFGV